MMESVGFKMWYTLAVVMIFNLVTPADAFFRHLCHGQLGVARVDPLMSPGTISGHVHNIQGSSGMSLAPTIEQLLDSNCTSCSIIQDKSAYWSPYMYFQHSNGTFELVPTSGGLTAYYFTERPDVGDEIHPFPQNFRMMTGNTYKRSNICPIPDPDMSEWGPSDETQAALMEKSIGFNCLNYSPGATTEGSLEVHYLRNKTFLDAQCLDGIRAEIQFPSCWNGIDLDSADHMSHIQYPSRLREGPCPGNFTTRLPTLFYETIYQTDLFSDVDGQFVFANGDPTGYGYHADFIAGWDDGVLQAVIDNADCTGPDVTGNQWDCPVFDLKSVDDPETLDCKMALPAELETQAINFVPQLPGNNPIQNGPQSATEQGVSASSTTLSTAASSSTAGYASSTASSGSSSMTGSPTLPLAPTLPSTQTEAAFTRTSFSTSSGTVYQWVVVEEIVTVTVTASASGHAKRHAHGFYHHGQ